VAQDAAHQYSLKDAALHRMATQHSMDEVPPIDRHYDLFLFGSPCGFGSRFEAGNSLSLGIFLGFSHRHLPPFRLAT
jgi:hypothetical protein